MVPVSNLSTKKVENLLFTGLILVTLFVNPLSNTDGINVPKLWVISAFSFALFSLIVYEFKKLFPKNRFTFFAILVFISFLLVALIVSRAPLEQQLFGTYARNTGFLAYLSLSIMFLASAIMTTSRFIKLLLIAALVTFTFNVIFGLIQYLGLDPFDWSTPYSPIIGTFGNPNFISAFLGMGIGLSTVLLFSKEFSKNLKFLLLLVILGAYFLIYESNSIQGLIVVAISYSVIAMTYLHTYSKNLKINIPFYFFIFTSFTLAIMGMLQKGPFSSFFYKPSVTYRGDYWRAGFEMMKDYPFFGIGLDSYGDWYRQYRTFEAIERRGPSAVTDSAHNVFFDISTTAGIPALIAYIVIVSLALRTVYKRIKSLKSFDPIFVAILVMWLGYLAQSVISINNLALAIWGWVLPGFLIAIDRTQGAESKTTPNDNSRTRPRINDFSGMIMSVGFLFGAALGFLPYNADANLKHAILSRNADQIIAANSKWPTDTGRSLIVIQVFSDNGYQEIAVKLARDLLTKNPRSFNAWYFLYKSDVVGSEEKKEILKKLKALDPNNPELKTLG